MSNPALLHKTENLVELNYFHIGNALGGSQDWMRDPWMKLGGCAALAAVDSFIYFTLFCGRKKLCPIDVHRLTKDSYIQFAMIMKPYISPRLGGVSKLKLYTKGVKKYLNDTGCDKPLMQPYPMGQPLEDAKQILQQQMNNGMLIPFLLLNPVSSEWKDYHWHWFLLTGYRREKDSLMVKAVTYGKGEWLPFSKLWDDKNRKNGGMILYEFSQTRPM